MYRSVGFHRTALLDLIQSPWDTLCVATPALDLAAAQLLRPHLTKPGKRLMLLTNLSLSALSGGRVAIEAIQLIRSLPGAEVRSLPELATALYLTGPDGPAIATGVPLVLAELENPTAFGIFLADGAPAHTQFTQWWQSGKVLTDDLLADLTVSVALRQEARTVGQEVASVGAFVRLSVRGTRRSRRLDPREFGAPAGEWGRSVRPVEVALYKLDDVIRAREELEGILAEQGVEWNGHYLVPRHFLERDWPRIFAARTKQLRDRLQSAEGKAALKSQLTQARQELEAFFTELYPRVETNGQDAATWINMQATRVLTETVSATILEDSGLEYRVLTIHPEDDRSVAEMQRLLEEPLFRSVQLTFPWT